MLSLHYWFRAHGFQYPQLFFSMLIWFFWLPDVCTCFSNMSLFLPHSISPNMRSIKGFLRFRKEDLGPCGPLGRYSRGLPSLPKTIKTLKCSWNGSPWLENQQFWIHSASIFRPGAHGDRHFAQNNDFWWFLEILILLIFLIFWHVWGHLWDNYFGWGRGRAIKWFP